MLMDPLPTAKYRLSWTTANCIGIAPGTFAAAAAAAADDDDGCGCGDERNASEMEPAVDMTSMAAHVTSVGACVLSGIQ